VVTMPMPEAGRQKEQAWAAACMVKLEGHGVA
jgi:hypothetical protein